MHETTVTTTTEKAPADRLGAVSEQLWALTAVIIGNELDQFSEEVRAAVLWLIHDLAAEARELLRRIGGGV